MSQTLTSWSALPLTNMPVSTGYHSTPVTCMCAPSRARAITDGRCFRRKRAGEREGEGERENTSAPPPNLTSTLLQKTRTHTWYRWAAKWLRLMLNRGCSCVGTWPPWSSAAWHEDTTSSNASSSSSTTRRWQLASVDSKSSLPGPAAAWPGVAMATPEAQPPPCSHHTYPCVKRLDG